MRVGLIACAAVPWLLCHLGAAELKKETIAAFDNYIRGTETRIAGQVSGKRSFLWVDESQPRLEQVMKGQAIAQPWNSRGEVEVPDGLIHDWIGAVFIPGTSLSKVLAKVRDYDNHYKIYQPEVVASKTLEQDKDHYRVYMKLLKKKIITAVLSTEHDVNYYPLSATRCHSRSYSTRIAQIADAGQSGEHELPVGNDSGFLWRLYSYWRFEERDGGVYMECQAISLTRGIPLGFGLLIKPIIRDLPKESLLRTLEGTRQALGR